MFRWLGSRVLWGFLMILGGVMFLLQNLNIITFGGLFWAVLLALAGVFFVSIFIQARDNWWALIPGFTLFSVALLITLGELAPRWAEVWGGGIVLGGIGLSFLVIYLISRENWWAVIPAGVLLTLAIITGIDSITSSGFETGGLFFLGLGLTFALVAILPTREGQMKWAWIPAGILLVMGVLIMAAAGDLIRYLWPLALILAGAYLVFRAIGRRVS